MFIWKYLRVGGHLILLLPVLLVHATSQAHVEASPVTRTLWQEGALLPLAVLVLVRVLARLGAPRSASVQAAPRDVRPVSGATRTASRCM